MFQSSKIHVSQRGLIVQSHLLKCRSGHMTPVLKFLLTELEILPKASQPVPIQLPLSSQTSSPAILPLDATLSLTVPDTIPPQDLCSCCSRCLTNAPQPHARSIFLHSTYHLFFIVQKYIYCSTVTSLHFLKNIFSNNLEFKTSVCMNDSCKHPHPIPGMELEFTKESNLPKSPYLKKLVFMEDKLKTLIT